MVSEALYQEKVEENKVLTLKIATLSLELENIKRALFGVKSERQIGTALSSTQQSLFEEEIIAKAEPVAAEKVTYERSKSRSLKEQPDRLDISDRIERRTVVVEPQGVDTSAMKRIGETINRRLQHIPASFLLVETIRPKYKDPVTGFIYQAPAVDQSFAKSSVDERRSLHCFH